ncbi:diguanylate cyclase (GGDEF)-like protein [Pseudosporangium ferrugineum]|uniref:Diguanylate cyclase (GGDEF)-like protein n=1 Tax=Pseudosporangium ferrugineum TaxID=439699 RepID=A0A2T0RWZ5_9ACTN|nr:diguanylate cyclase (GGDEF)-like protein [Pseudosporangium ferrugineum]
MLRRVAGLPNLASVTLRSATRASGGDLIAGALLPALDEQAQLLADLVEVMARDIPSLDHILAIVDRRLSGSCGMTAATVFTLDPDDGSLRPAATRGPAAADDLRVAGRVFRVSAGAPPVRAGDRTAVRLRIGGQTVGVLVLTGTDLDRLRPETAAGTALQVAATLQVLAAEVHRQYTAHATATIRKLFEEGATATSVEAAGQLLAKATGEAFRTERAAVHLVGPDGTIRYAVGVGLTDEMGEELRRNLVGRSAQDSPVWKIMQEIDGPVLVPDARTSDVRPGGFVETLRLRSFLAMPLMSASGPVGVVLCGDSRPREWTGRDHALARQVAMEGALIVDGARLRQAEQQHVAELTRQAYHDALTGLPNRSHLMERAEREVEIATATGGRIALLLLDLDGFKRVNDTVGHHAGDALLQTVGLRLQTALRDHDVVARLGGDEFAVLLTRNPDGESAAAIAGRIHARLSRPYDIEGRRVTVGASIGIALFPADADDMAGLMRNADAAMYRAKRSGGGVLPAG